MNVLSLFDGMSCGQLALNRAGIKYDTYFASEIDKYAIKVTRANFPNTVQIGDVTEVVGSLLPQIDLLIGGSPCQGFSFAGKQLNFTDPRSFLFFEFVRLLHECKPKYFLLENVKMKKEYQDVISEYLGVQPILINSKLVSAQNRVRLYWTNIPGVEQPGDRGILLKDILEDNVDIRYNITEATLSRMILRNMDLIVRSVVQLNESKESNGCQPFQQNRVYDVDGIAPALLAEMSCGTHAINDNEIIRRLTEIECERLQTVPDNYTNHVSSTQRYKMIGLGWTIDVIAHILKNITTQYSE